MRPGRKKSKKENAKQKMQNAKQTWSTLSRIGSCCLGNLSSYFGLSNHVPKSCYHFSQLKNHGHLLKNMPYKSFEEVKDSVPSWFSEGFFFASAAFLILQFRNFSMSFGIFYMYSFSKKVFRFSQHFKTVLRKKNPDFRQLSGKCLVLWSLVSYHSQWYDPTTDCGMNITASSYQTFSR